VIVRVREKDRFSPSPVVVNVRSRARLDRLEGSFPGVR
jgi:hypothetical protein